MGLMGGEACSPVREGITGGGAATLLGTGGDAVLPISNPGTDTPACPSRPSAPWFRIPLAGSATGGLLVYPGGGESGVDAGCGFLAGNLGGRAGGGLAPAAVVGDPPMAPGRNAGGLGR